MEFIGTADVKKEGRKLWKDYLLAGIVNDLMMTEIKDQLYLSHVDTKEIDHLPPEERPRALARKAARLGFSDAAEEAAESLMENRKALWPYSEWPSGSPEKDARAILKAIKDHVHYYPRKAAQNDYMKYIKPGKARERGIRLGTADVLPYEFFQVYHEREEQNPFFFAEAGFFDETVSFPVVWEKNRVWMSIVLSEIQSMKEPVQKASGKVITYGLGLGYYLFMCSQKKDVSSVTAVEINPAMIDLFKKDILPYFPHKEKVHIIHADAMEFVKRQKDGDYDYAFSDFWAGFYDGLLLYTKFYPLTVRFHRTEHSYWIEKCFIDYFFRPAMMHFMREALFHEPFPWEEDRKDIVAVLKDFSSFLKRKEGVITTGSALRQFFSYEKALSLVHEWLALEKA